MADQTRDHERPRRTPRRTMVVVACLAVVILIPAAIGFVDKLVQFFRTARSGAQGGFALLPVLLYLSVSAGFLCLLIWAIFQGMFRDIEGPKYTMLETEERLERRAGAPRLR